MSVSPLVRALLQEVLAADAGPDLHDNVDPVRYPGSEMGPPPGTVAERLSALLAHADGFELLYGRLEHEAEKALMVRLLAFRVLGHHKVRLPLTLARLRELIVRAESARTEQGTEPVGILGWQADDYDLRALGFPIRVRCYVAAVVQTFELEQYRCAGAPEIAPRSGDVIVDGGAHWGDTALYFAAAAGAGGRVVSFEFEPMNLAVFAHNMQLNPELARCIELVPAALWHQAGESVAVHSYGPGTQIRPDGEASAPTDTIDALLERGSVPRVDFVKLDVEGAELNALRGAEATLRRFRPRLAIAAYHRPEDLAAIPAYLDGLGLGYRFRLAHFTMHGEETVLFAIADRQ
jgi:FkbM family methyltransferase